MREAEALVVTGDPPPSPGEPANGAGLRAWGIAYGLRQLGIDARLVAPSDSLPPDHLPLPEDQLRLERRSIAGALALSQQRGQGPCPALVFQHWGIMDEVLQALSHELQRRPAMALDLAGPHLLEREFLGSHGAAESLASKMRALQRSDYLQCGGTTQSAYFRGLAALASASPAPPVSIAEFVLPVRDWSQAPGEPSQLLRALESLERPLLLFCGLALPWQDPRWALGEALHWLDTQGHGTLLVVSPPLGVGGSSGFGEAIENHARTRRLGKLAFDDVLDICRAADLAVDLFAPNDERLMAVPSRTAAYAAAGLPILFNDYSDWSAAMGSVIPGAAVAHGDSASFSTALHQLVGHARGRVGERPFPRLAGAHDSVAELLSPERNLVALAAWIRAARSAERPGWLDIQPAAPDVLRAMVSDESILEGVSAPACAAIVRRWALALHLLADGEQMGDSRSGMLPSSGAPRPRAVQFAARIAAPVAGMAGTLLSPLLGRNRKG